MDGFQNPMTALSLVANGRSGRVVPDVLGPSERLLAAPVVSPSMVPLGRSLPEISARSWREDRFLKWPSCATRCAVFGGMTVSRANIARGTCTPSPPCPIWPTWSTHGRHCSPARFGKRPGGMKEFESAQSRTKIMNGRPSVNTSNGHVRQGKAQYTAYHESWPMASSARLCCLSNEPGL